MKVMQQDALVGVEALDLYRLQLQERLSEMLRQCDNLRTETATAAEILSYIDEHGPLEEVLPGKPNGEV